MSKLSACPHGDNKHLVRPELAYCATPIRFKRFIYPGIEDLDKDSRFSCGIIIYDRLHLWRAVRASNLASKPGNVSSLRRLRYSFGS
ncbi:hypothetical protein NPIL_146391 [Nephila pilipes]|uniref:Uncharacterized protein n=1 Tax=Nephila pilipes TaxID=299642 RepID=A0A8X6Q491_NEPPI|nr:hypothetical protein NPIL_146391 [Nephila pilipes]